LQKIFIFVSKIEKFFRFSAFHCSPEARGIPFAYCCSIAIKSFRKEALIERGTIPEKVRKRKGR